MGEINLADIANIVASVSVFIAVISLAKEIKNQNIQSFFYLHEYLSQDHFSEARRQVRKKIYKKSFYSDYSEKELEFANRVCASYDQAGIIIKTKMINKNIVNEFIKSSWGRSIVDQYCSLKLFLDEQQTPNKIGRDFFEHFTYIYKLCLEYHKAPKFYAIRSGGQSGVDQGALKSAKELNYTITGWVPKDGWAENMEEKSNGILSIYPELKETDSSEVNVRTELNARDSDASLILFTNSTKESKGTNYTVEMAKKYNKPYFIYNDENDKKALFEWIENLDENIILNVGGPRESECPGAYEKTYHLMKEILKKYSLS